MEAMLNPDASRRGRVLLVGSVGLLSVAAWLTLWMFGTTLHGPAQHHHHLDTAGSVSGVFMFLFVMGWTVMTLAMMLPTSLPIIATFQTIAGQRPDRPLLITLVIVGYLAVWTLVGFVVCAAGVAIQGLAAVNPWVQAHAYVGGALVLLLAGSYQFTPLKRRCLDKCRSPLSFVLAYWQGDRQRRNAFRLGVHHGLFCVGCCWALMLLMFGVGVSSLAWMLMLGAVMAVEKNVSWGRRLSAPLGALLLSFGVIVLALRAFVIVSGAAPPVR
jgi:predicted metal-binding membrane protein